MSRKSFSLNFKLKVIEEAEKYKGPKKDICEKFEIAPSTLSTFLKDQKKIQSNRLTGTYSSKRQKMCSSTNNTVDRAVFLWIKQVRSSNLL